MRILVRKRVIRTDNGKMLRDLIIKFSVLEMSELCILENCAVCKRSSKDIFYSRCATLNITVTFNDYRFIPHAQLTHLAKTMACQ